ncbi:RND transporter MFP subunit [Pokkaliibacter plantistimulans]|uniref:RND transporter MFP subunit n=1 Tax=Pokkaliibacter plantistimulans TaxID=1635171 RepID=A0ABX5M1H6_9GAMM|nr:efflux RND transporter periplasmic adaptor subunit [Pokkaliibacter plantistimulans]PXF32737.1 RND transporter MFP subunit [Pokkaliibacter plantistimulans]
MKRQTKLTFAAGGAMTLLAAVLVSALGLQSSQAEDVPAAVPQATPVSVASVIKRNVTRWSEFSGRMEAVERVDVRSRVAGAVQEVHFVEGALVKKGDLLFSIDPALYQAAVDQAAAQVAAAKARVAYTRSELERAQRLVSKNAIAQREVDQRLNERREADANLLAAQAALQTAKLNLSYTEVRAPVAGRVGKVEITVGNLVAAGPGAPVLTSLVSVSPIYASFDADERTVARTLEGLSSRKQLDSVPVQISTGNDAEISGHLQLVDNQVDSRSGTIRLRAVFDNQDGNLIPGQFARIHLGEAAAEPVVLINDRAVGTDQNKKFVMVLEEDNITSYREVALGDSIDGLREVTSGLHAGERIVINGLQRVRPGSLVMPQVVPMASDAAAAAANASNKPALSEASAGAEGSDANPS